MRYGLRLVLIWLVLATSPAAGWAAGDKDRGESLAKLWCTSCHMVDRTSRTARDTAPSFPALATESPSALRGFLMAPHPPMPGLDLSNQQIDDIVAYIESLAAN